MESQKQSLSLLVEFSLRMDIQVFMCHKYWITELVANIIKRIIKLLWVLFSSVSHISRQCTFAGCLMLQFTIILDIFLDCWYIVAEFCKFLSNFFRCLCAVFCLVSQSCLTLCDSMDYSPPGCSGHGDSPGKNTGVGCHALFQGTFPTQGSNPCLPHCRQILYCLSHQGSPGVSTVVNFIF